MENMKICSKIIQNSYVVQNTTTFLLKLPRFKNDLLCDINILYKQHMHL